MMGSQLDNGKKPLRSPGDGMANSFRHPDDRRVLEPIHNSLKKNSPVVGMTIRHPEGMAESFRHPFPTAGEF